MGRKHSTAVNAMMDRIYLSGPIRRCDLRGDDSKTIKKLIDLNWLTESGPDGAEVYSLSVEGEYAMGEPVEDINARHSVEDDDQ